NAARVGEYLKNTLMLEIGSLKGIKEIRGYGLMIGIELDKPCGVIMSRALDAGLLLSVTADSVIRLVPALIMTEKEADEVVALLTPIVKTFLNEST
ncbi:MAG: aminotransferase class III-fold pyridoxal phosphate-dependent enzyme, partial [Betaproteobacteria bacterium]|nr:aminotransferase class III-fold pyridoxal phosphate-dependent enzyme [Betaproteobacteria bacterium]